VKGRERGSLATLVDGGVGTSSTMEVPTRKDKPLDMMGNERENSLTTSEGGGISSMEYLTMLDKPLDKRKDMSNMDLATGNVGLKTRRDLKVNVDIAVEGRNGEENVQSSFSFNNKESV